MQNQEEKNISKKKENYHEKYDAFYHSKEWISLRNYKFVEVNGLCEQCLAKGIVKQGKEVHHIVPIEKDWSKRLHVDNIILLCPDCHNEAHGRVSALQNFKKMWEGIDAETTPK